MPHNAAISRRNVTISRRTPGSDHRACKIARTAENNSVGFSSAKVPRNGFSLLEFVVLIAVVVVLLALLLPNVQFGREQARRRQCADKMRELGLGFQQYLNSHDAFPAGTLNPDGPIRNAPVGKHVSWTVQLLPLIGLPGMYEEFDISLGTYAAENRPVRIERIPQLLCPSSPGPVAADTDGKAGPFPHSNYAGCHHDVEAPIDDDNLGILFLNSELHLADIADGAGNTILVGEIPPEPGLLGWASGTRATLRNTSNIMDPAQRQRAASGDGVKRGPFEVGGFGSFHVNGINALYAGGSVEFIAQSIDRELLHELGNRSDSEADLDVELDEVLP